MQVIFNEVSAGLTFNMKVVSCQCDQGSKARQDTQKTPRPSDSLGKPWYCFAASQANRAKKTWGLLGFYPVSFLSKLSPKQVAGGSEDDKTALKPGKRLGARPLTERGKSVWQERGKLPTHPYIPHRRSRRNVQSEPISGVEDGAPKRRHQCACDESFDNVFLSTTHGRCLALTRSFITGGTPSGFAMIRSLQSLRSTLMPQNIGRSCLYTGRVQSKGWTGQAI